MVTSDPASARGHQPPEAGQSTPQLRHGDELDDNFSGLQDTETGTISIAGFGSLLSIRSARSTFPDLKNFRVRQVEGFRRVFAHTAPVFFERGIARLDTMEISSLSCEEAPGSSIVVAVFDIPNTTDMVAAILDREHEFRFLALRATAVAGAAQSPSEPNVSGSHESSTLQPESSPHTEPLAVICGRWNDEEYKKRRCPPNEFKRRFLDHGVDKVWRDDILPCRAYLRHCVLAAESLGRAAHDSFLDDTCLADRSTTVRQYLKQHPSIMEELPPESVIGRYSG